MPGVARGLAFVERALGLLPRGLWAYLVAHGRKS
jgi:hypothetical protein